MCEVVELIANAIIPLHAMKQIISQAINDDKKFRNAIGIVCVPSAKYRLNSVWIVKGAQLESLEVRRRLTAVEITVLEIGEAL